MKKSYVISFLAFLAFSLFLIESTGAAAYEAKVDLSTPGSGTGKVTFSATSSNDFEFSGWTGACSGKGICPLRDLFPKSSKIVIANFNAPICTEFSYSEFGGCQIDGTERRAVVSAGPLGCVGGNPVTSKGCFYDPCVRAQSTQVDDR